MKELSKREQIALDHIVLEEAQKHLNATPKEKFLKKLKSYGLAIGFTNLLGGTVGYLTGGLDGALEAMSDVSIGMVPYAIGCLELAHFKLSKYKNVNDLAEIMKTGLERAIKYVDNAAVQKINLGLQILGAAGLYYGFSHISEWISGIDINNGLIAGIGGTVGAISAGSNFKTARKYLKKIKDFIKENPDIIKEKRGRRLDPEELENVVDYMHHDPKKAGEIAYATKKKRFEGVPFFGKLEELSEDSKDPLRVRPKIAAEWHSGTWGMDQYPEFTFEYDGEEDKLLELVRTVNNTCNGVKLDIHAMFDDAKLDDLMKDPYKSIHAIHLRGKKDDKEYFHVHYSRIGDHRIEVEIKSREHISLVNDVFRVFNNHDIEDVDFDSELMELSKGDYGKAQLEPSAEESSPFRKEEKEPEGCEESGELSPVLVLDAYVQNKDKIQNAFAYDGLGVAVEGAVYILTPMEYEKTGVKKVIEVVKDPIGAVKHLVTEGQLLPELRQAEIITQYDGITRENVFEVLSHMNGVEVDPSLFNMDYQTFWKLRENPQLLADKAHMVEIKNGAVQAKIFFREPDCSYATLRNEKFPTREELERKYAEKGSAQYQVMLNSILGKEVNTAGSALEAIRIKDRLENPSYDLQPDHAVIYNKDHTQAFGENSTLIVSTRKEFFSDNPVHLKEGINAVTEYFGKIREAVDKVDN